VTENLYYGPDQSQADLRFWRFFSDTIVEWKDGPVTLAAVYDIGTERVAELAGHPRTLWTGGAFYASWNVSGPWSVALRPEFYWDRNGRITGSEQLLNAVTTTVEYRWTPIPQVALLRLEHRYDESSGGREAVSSRVELSPRWPGSGAGATSFALLDRVVDRSVTFAGPACGSQAREWRSRPCPYGGGPLRMACRSA
jgi:hypothetical protein